MNVPQRSVSAEASLGGAAPLNARLLASTGRYWLTTLDWMERLKPRPAAAAAK